jgi:hypothetical protein
MLEDLYNWITSYDSARLALSITESYGLLASSPLTLPIALSAVLVLLLIAFTSFKETLAMKFTEWGGQCAKYAKCAWVTLKSAASFWERRKMRINREEAHLLRIKDVIIKHIEDQVDEGLMTRTEANHMYSVYAHAHKDFRYCIEKPKSVKAAIAERLANTNRSKDGKVIPAPLPKEEPAQNTPMVRRRTPRTT